MGRHFLALALALTPSVRAQQALNGACMGHADAPLAAGADILSSREIGFIEARDSFYLATVSEIGWPYVQHRGGRPGFVRHLDETSFGWAEYAGNRQHISLGNTAADNRVALIFVDYPGRRRLKIFGRLRAYEADSRPDLALQLDDGREEARVEHLMLVTVEALDWNCPRHITPRYTKTEVGEIVAPLRARIAELESQRRLFDGALDTALAAATPKPSGSRRQLMLGASIIAAAAGLTGTAGAQTNPARRTDPQFRSEGHRTMTTVTTPDGTQLYVKDWGRGRPVVFSHGWPLSADAFEDQMFFLAERGFRCIAHDRRGHGRSSQPWQGNDLDTYADDLAAVVRALDLRDAIHVGHSTGGGEVARYIGRHGTGRVAKAVLIGAIPPLMLKTAANPDGTPIAAFDQLRNAVQADRSQFWRDLSLPFYGYNRPDAKISEGVREDFWRQSMMAGFPASYFCIKAFSETDLTEDLGRFDVPTLVLHGSDDQIVPIGASAMRSSKLIRNAKLKVYDGAPHGLCTTLKDRVNAELLAFLA